VRRPVLLALIAFVAALSLRLTNASTAFVDGEPRFSPLDELYHAKRMAYSAAHFPHMLERDPDRGVTGLWCPWPPLYDLAAGGAARLFGATRLSDVIRVVVWFPPLLFALFVAAATFLVARDHGGVAGALIAAALASSPFLVHFSSIGAIDHHFLEPPLAFAIAFATIRASRAADARGAGVLLGAAMIAAMFVQTALLIACAIAFLLLFLNGGQTAGWIAFTIAALAVGAYAFTRDPGYPINQWFLGWPHAAIFYGAAAALFLRARGAPRLLALIAGGALTAAFPAAGASIFGGAHFLGGDPWLRTIAEFLPVISEPPIDLISDIALLSGGAVLVWFLVRRRDATSRTVALFAILYVLLDLSSRRFRPLAISFLALAGALVAAQWFAEGRRRAAFIAILLVAIPPPLQLALWMRTPDNPVEESQMPSIRAAAFLQRQSAGGRVLAPWSMGHTLDVLGGRPVILDNFGSMPDRLLFERAHDALLTNDEATLARECDAMNVRWIVFDNPVYDLPEAANIVSVDAANYVAIGSSGEATHITKLAQATCWWRAYFHRGAAQPRQGMFGKPLTRYRLVYVDPQPAWRGSPVDNGPAVEIWERQ
jgi:hypothetical protein